MKLKSQSDDYETKGHKYEIKSIEQRSKVITFYL